MSSLPAQVVAFLDKKQIAVVGVSRDPQQPANAIYRRLKSTGHQVYAVNPRTAQAEGDSCFPNLQSIPAPVEAVMIVTPPQESLKIVRDCQALGIRQVWFHRSFGDGSVSEEAIRECEQNNIDCLVGGCPMMYCGNVDFGHRCMKWILNLQHRVPG
jgi:hypothetical protein